MCMRAVLGQDMCVRAVRGRVYMHGLFGAGMCVCVCVCAGGAGPEYIWGRVGPLRRYVEKDIKARQLRKCVQSKFWSEPTRVPIGL